MVSRTTIESSRWIWIATSYRRMASPGWAVDRPIPTADAAMRTRETASTGLANLTGRSVSAARAVTTLSLRGARMVPDVDGIRRFPTPGKQPVAHEDGLGDIDQLAVRVASLGPEHLERLSFVDGMAFHQDPLGPLRDSPPGKRALEVLILGESSKHDVDRALELARVLDAGDVGEDASLRCLPDEQGILPVEDGDHRTGGLVHDPVDPSQRILGPFTDDDDGHVRPFRGCRGPNPRGLSLLDHPMTERFDRARDVTPTLLEPTDDEDAQRSESRIHRLLRARSVLRPCETVEMDVPVGVIPFAKPGAHEWSTVVLWGERAYSSGTWPQ